MTKVFISGPSGSGKTVFGVGLYNYLCGESGEAHLNNKVISFSNSNARRLDELYLYMVQNLDYPKATRTDELIAYIFERKSWLHGQLTIEFLDYGGEHIKRIAELLRNPTKFNKFLIDIKENFKNDKNIKNKIEKKSLNFDDLYNIISRNKITNENIKDIVEFYIICRFLMSNKILLLVDGRKLLEYVEGSNVNIIEDLINYKIILDYIIKESKKLNYPKKEIALVITKADLFDNIFEYNILDDYNEFIDSIDKYLLEDKPMPTYKELRRNIDKIFATSVQILKSERQIVTFGFDRITNWLNRSSLLGGRLL